MGLAPWLTFVSIAALTTACDMFAADAGPRALPVRINTVANPTLHIVEHNGVVDNMMLHSPTGKYHDAFAVDMQRRHPHANRHLVEHMVSLEAFLDWSIVVGLSFGVGKAHIAAEHGKLLGHLIGRGDSKPDPERTAADRPLSLLKEKVRVQ